MGKMKDLAYEKELEDNLRDEMETIMAMACPDCMMMAEMCGASDCENGDSSTEYKCIDCGTEISVKRKKSIPFNLNK